MDLSPCACDVCACRTTAQVSPHPTKAMAWNIFINQVLQVLSNLRRLSLTSLEKWGVSERISDEESTSGLIENDMGKQFAWNDLLMVAAPAWSQSDFEEQGQKFNTLLYYMDQLYVEDTDMESLVETAIVNMLEEMDPHSVYILQKNSRPPTSP